ncbi:E3 ubiquitin/ISG15 ligase TRIM25-like [Hemibagrus wyckioides]|uniref:E3 ubiquitin/ISG15 ligase TRIM25-like n=1 Tax=Hemibagrus wyckioides TaxID=337641 RepID=UPI00266D71A3|nr:E3 ubiquitin/ISG15 ligase TRIM25-like [Hemibagrus wyckioides]
MAEASISVAQDHFSCPVCLDLLKDPVTTPCGHSFCKVCINGCWDQEDQKGVYSCPQCRDTFTPRPVLRRNNMLAEVMEKLKKTEVQAASPAHCYTGPGDVECDFCTWKKRKAIKSCLVCVASLCENHFKSHREIPALKNHTVGEASTNLQEKICSEHNKLIEIYCHTDQTCICYLCMMDKHKGHDTVTAAAERAEKQSELKEDQMKFQQRIQEKQKKVQELKQTVNTIKLSAQTAVDDSERIFTEMISSMEKKRSEVTELIRAQEKAELSPAERLLEQLEQEIADLQRRDTEMEQLSHTHDHIHFLQSFQSVSSGHEDSSITVSPRLSFDDLRKYLLDMKTQLEEFCPAEFKISLCDSPVQMTSVSEPESREDFLKYFRFLTLDPNTVNQHIILSDDDRMLRHSWRDPEYFDHPERFDYQWQVLCEERVCGRTYWEVEWMEEDNVEIAVAYRGISRKAQQNESLSLSLSPCEFRKMAEASISVDQDQFICPVCRDLLKDPVTTPCGHSFCKVCINGCWNQEDQKGVYSCPQCRDTFTPRPVLRRNNMLATVKNLNKTKFQAASPAQWRTIGPGDVECDLCTRRKHKAVKSCLVCVASLCETHLKPHYLSPAFKNHTLIEASAKLKEKICSEHEKLMEMYCRTDKTCICFMCTMDKHRGHDTVTAAEERAEKESELKEEQMKFQQRVQEKQKKVQELKQTVNTIKFIAQTAVDDNERIFTEMISSMEKKRSEVTELIRAQEKAELSRAERLLEQLEQEIADLQRRVTELEQLSHTHDHIHFLQALASGRRSSLFDRPNFDGSSVTVPQHLSFDGVRNSLSDLKKRLEEFCEEELNKIPPHAVAVQIISIPEPQSREEFLEYFCYLTLNPNTTHRILILSKKNRMVRVSKGEQQYSDHPERFDSWPQVLCKESVCGRCYWEVEWSGTGVVLISVSYKDISRKGDDDECGFGNNNQSWSLRCSSSSLSFYHNNVQTDLRVPSSSRIGVYVDHSAGTLSFYSVSDTMKLLHRVHTTFTQPLYAGFGTDCLFGFISVRLCDPK